MVDPEAPMPIQEKKAGQEITEYEKYNNDLMFIEEEKTRDYTFKQKFKYVLS